MSEQFESLRNDPDLQAEPGPHGTLIFVDGDQYCVVGPDFIDMQESSCVSFGSTKQEAILNYRRAVLGSEA